MVTAQVGKTAVASNKVCLPTPNSVANDILSNTPSFSSGTAVTGDSLLLSPRPSGEWLFVLFCPIHLYFFTTAHVERFLVLVFFLVKGWPWLV